MLSRLTCWLNYKYHRADRVCLQGLPVAEHCKRFLEKVLRGGYGDTEQENMRVAGANFLGKHTAGIAEGRGFTNSTGLKKGLPCRNNDEVGRSGKQRGYTDTSQGHPG